MISETRKPRPHGAILAWIASVPSDRLFISAVTIGELQRGVERVRKHDPSKGDEIHAWIGKLGDAYEIVASEAADFRLWAYLMVGRANHTWEDALIAATARNRGLTVATRNVQDFRGLDVEVINPFEYKNG